MSFKRIKDYFLFLEPEVSSKVIEYILMRTMIDDIQKIEI
jgi:hypothetical protein